MGNCSSCMCDPRGQNSDMNGNGAVSLIEFVIKEEFRKQKGVRANLGTFATPIAPARGNFAGVA